MRGQSSDTRRKGRRSNPGISRTNYRVQCGLDAWAVESLLPPCLEILGLCGHVISICRGMTQSNDTYVISPPKLFTKPSATTMTPQQKHYERYCNHMVRCALNWVQGNDTHSTSMDRFSSARDSCQRCRQRANWTQPCTELTRELRRVRRESIRSQSYTAVNTNSRTHKQNRCAEVVPQARQVEIAHKPRNLRIP